MAWDVEEIRRRMNEWSEEKKGDLSSKTLPSKKTRWKKAMKK